MQAATVAEIKHNTVPRSGLNIIPAAIAKVIPGKASNE